MVDHTSTLTSLQRALRGERTAGGLDVEFTKLAIDLQNLDEEHAESVLSESLTTLRDAIDCDAVGVALLDFAGRSVERMFVARSTFSACNPEVLEGMKLADWPWLERRLVHLRLLGILDATEPATGQEIDAERLAELHIGAAMFVGFEVDGHRIGFMGFFYGQAQQNWCADHQLLIKLLGSSFASGLGRLRSTKSLDEAAERDALILRTANDGMWDFDAINNVLDFSPRWKSIMGYTDDDISETPPDWRKLVHPDDMARVQAQLRDHLAGKT